jgi:hypothetical protein
VCRAGWCEQVATFREAAHRVLVLAGAAMRESRAVITPHGRLLLL